MDANRKILQLAVVVAIVGYVHSSCDLIGLPKCECRYPRSKRYEVDCHARGFSKLPGQVNYTLQEGDATGNFSYNSISEIPNFYFLYMKHFDILDFTSNSISKLEENSLTGLKTILTSLNLSKNRLSSIPPMALRYYIRLKMLDLSGNKVSSPCQIHTADVMTYSLAYNGITQLPDQCFKDSTKVQTLDLTGNRITSIGSEAFRGMDLLVTLSLADNQLSDLGNGLHSLISLDKFESLSLRGNQIKYLSSVCRYVLPYIHSIDFGYNRLLDIQQFCFKPYSTAGHVSSLFLNFEHNHLTSLAGFVFTGLEERLTQLKLNHNQISEVNVNAFKSLEKLRLLNMDNNRITSLEFLRDWEDNTLQEFSINNNLVRELSPRVFSKMLRLTKLSLDGNLLLSIESSAFMGMSVLNDLSIRYNLITNLADGAFMGLGQLKKLGLSGNALVTLKNCTFANLDRLVQFHFEDNLLHCDCDLLWLMEFNAVISGRGVLDKNIAEPVLEDYCHYPDSIKGMYMVNAVSINCRKQMSTNACFGLNLAYDDAEVGEAMNVSWKWDSASGRSFVKSIQLSQLDVETNEVVYNNTVTATVQPITMPVLQRNTVYKV